MATYNISKYKKDILPIVDDSGSFSTSGNVTAANFIGNGSQLTNLPLPELADSFFSFDAANFVNGVAGNTDDFVAYSIGAQGAASGTIYYNPGVTVIASTFNDAVDFDTDDRLGNDLSNATNTQRANIIAASAQWAYADVDKIIYCSPNKFSPVQVTGWHTVQLWISTVSAPWDTSSGRLNPNTTRLLTGHQGPNSNEGATFIVPKGFYYNVYTKSSQAILPYQVLIADLAPSILKEAQSLVDQLQGIDLGGSETLFDATPANLIAGTPGNEGWEYYEKLFSNNTIDEYVGVTLSTLNNNVIIPITNRTFKLAENDLYVIVNINTDYFAKVVDCYVSDIANPTSYNSCASIHSTMLGDKYVDSPFPVNNEEGSTISFIIPKGVYYNILAHCWMQSNANPSQKISVRILPLNAKLKYEKSLMDITPSNFIAGTPSTDDKFVCYTIGADGAPLNGTITYYSGVTHVTCKTSEFAQSVNLEFDKTSAVGGGGTDVSPIIASGAIWAYADVDKIAYINPASTKIDSQYSRAELWISSVASPWNGGATGTLDSTAIRLAAISSTNLATGGEFIIPKGFYYVVFVQTGGGVASPSNTDGPEFPLKVRIADLAPSILGTDVADAISNINIVGADSLFNASPTNLIAGTPGQTEDWEYYTHTFSSGNTYSPADGLIFNNGAVAANGTVQRKLAEKDLLVILSADKRNPYATVVCQIYSTAGTNDDGGVYIFNQQDENENALYPTQGAFQFIIPKGVYYVITYGTSGTSNITFTCTILPLNPTLQSADSLFNINATSITASPPNPSSDEDWEYFRPDDPPPGPGDTGGLADNEGYYDNRGIIWRNITATGLPSYEYATFTYTDKDYLFKSTVRGAGGLCIHIATDANGTNRTIFDNQWHGAHGSDEIDVTTASVIVPKGLWVCPEVLTTSASNTPNLFKIPINTLPIKQSGGVPTGAVQAFARLSAPDGWIICDGAEYSKTDGAYVPLFLAIGTTYGETNGSGGSGFTHFRVPDLRGQFVRGWDSRLPTEGGNDKTDGANARVFGSTQNEDIISHKHESVYTWPNGPLEYRMSNAEGITGPPINTTPSGTTNRETRPTNVALLYCIKL